MESPPGNDCPANPLCHPDLSEHPCNHVPPPPPASSPQTSEKTEGIVAQPWGPLEMPSYGNSMKTPFHPFLLKNSTRWGDQSPCPWQGPLLLDF